MKSPYQIALIVLYFGPLLPYFPIWLESAKANPDINFLFYTDQEIQIDAPNFRVTTLPLDALRRRFEQTLNRSLVISNGYKLCDYRPAFGVLFEEDLRGYDFWGYCDIDLVFGQIRRFLTDEILGAYDRFYAYGYFSLYRNNAAMRRAYERSGAVFTTDEMFGPFHIGMDEFVGINRICLKHHIPWYTNVDYAQLNACLKERLEIKKGQANYPAQLFYWRDGRAFQRYADGIQIRERELAFIHWYRKRPVPERSPRVGEAVVITPKRLLVRSPQDLTPENMLRWNPPISTTDRVFQTLKCHAKKFEPLFKGAFALKRIRFKTYVAIVVERKLKKALYP